MKSPASAKSAVPPRYRAVPAARSSAGPEATELAASAGLILDPWQALYLDDALAENDAGNWAAFECGLIVPRQNGKGGLIEARELAGLFLFGERLIIHSAHEFKTAAEGFLRVLALIQSTPDLDRHVKKITKSHGEEGIELLSGQRLRFITRSKGSGRGFSGDTVILDEAYNLQATSLAALLPTMAARPNPQLWVTSSAPLDTEESAVLRRFCRRGRQAAAGADDAMAYSEFSADPDADDAEPQVWASANPASPHRVALEFLGAMRKAMPAEQFRREALGIWVDHDEETEQALPAEQWAACLSPSAGIDGTPMFALDLSPDRKWAAIAAAGRSTADKGRTAVEIIDTKPGTGWVVDRARALHERWGGKLAVAKGSPAAALVPKLTAAGVTVDLVAGDDVVRSCGQLLVGVAGETIHHRGQPELDVAITKAATRAVGDAWTWSRRLSPVDISPLVAATLAVGAYGAAPPPVNLATQIF